MYLSFFALKIDMPGTKDPMLLGVIIHRNILFCKRSMRTFCHVGPRALHNIWREGVLSIAATGREWDTCWYCGTKRSCLWYRKEVPFPLVETFVECGMPAAPSLKDSSIFPCFTQDKGTTNDVCPSTTGKGTPSHSSWGLLPLLTSLSNGRK